MQEQTIRRLADGSIDYSHYTRRGRRLRAEAQRDFLTDRGGIIRPRVVLALIAAPLLLAAAVNGFTDRSASVGTEVEPKTRLANR